MSRYAHDAHPAPIAYSSGLVDFDFMSDSYLDFNGDLNTTIEWLLSELSQVDTSKVKEVVLATSTLLMNGEEISRLWDRLISPDKYPSLENTAWCAGKGCNVLTHAAGESFRKIKGTRGAVLIICLEMHKPSTSRFCDFAFFSDAAAFLLLSNEPGRYEILESNTLISFDTKNFAFSCSFPREIYPEGTKMYTLHTFPFLLARKYQSAPRGVCITSGIKVKPHYYSLDPFIDLFTSSDADGSNKIIHVESPPFHVDEIRIATRPNA